MSVVIDGTTGITAAAFDGAVDAGDLTGTLPALDGSAITSLSAGNLTGNVAAARITGALNATGSAPIYACRAWVNFNGTGTVAIRASGNVSSITDNGTGNYTVNFATAMPDENYAYSHSYSNEVNGQHTIGFFDSISSSQLRVRHYNASDSSRATDKGYVSIAIFR
jgi:hypothetical protein